MNERDELGESIIIILGLWVKKPKQALVISHDIARVSSFEFN